MTLPAELGEQRFRAASEEDTRRVAARLAGALAGAGPALIGLDGELGAGKTTFVQGFAAALDPAGAERVSSPTYAIAQVYRTRPPVTHMDLYRLSDLADLEAIGYREHYFNDGITLVEWISRVPEAIPREWIEINLAVLPTGVREIRVRGHGPRLAPLVTRLTE